MYFMNRSRCLEQISPKLQVKLCCKSSLYLLHPKFDKEQHANDSQKVCKGDPIYLGFRFTWRRYYSVILAVFSYFGCLLSSQHENDKKMNRLLKYKKSLSHQRDALKYVFF